jgi:hypothetical protein
MSQDQKYEFIKGSDFYPNFYNENIIKEVYIRFYQITLFNNKNKRLIRSFLIKGKTSEGACLYDYKIIEAKIYMISERKLNKFINYLTNILPKQKANNNDIKTKYKFYPVYDFVNTPPPNGNEINECISELLN